MLAQVLDFVLVFPKKIGKSIGTTGLKANIESSEFLYFELF